MSHIDFDNIIPTLNYFVDRRCTSRWQIEKAIISFHDLTYVDSGHSIYRVNGTEYHLQRGDCIYIAEGSLREAYTSEKDPMHCFAANFTLKNINGKRPQLPLPIVFKVGVLNEIIRHYQDLSSVWVEKGPGFQMQSRAIFMLILHTLITHVNYNEYLFPTDCRILKAKEYICTHYPDRIEINDLANRLRLHPVYFGALFKKIMHCTVKEYINHVRVNNAENLLSTGEYSASEAAECCGFSDLFYFSKVFKRYKGYPPSSVRK